MSRALLSAVLAAAALALAGTPVPSRDRLRLASPTILVSPVRTGAGRWAWLRSRVLAAGLAGLAAGLVVGGWPGAVVGPLVAVASHRFIGGLEPAAVRQRRLRIAAELPLAVDLLVVCLSAGQPVGAATSVVAEAVGGPLGTDLGLVGARVELGGDPLAVWSGLSRDPTLGTLARAVTRSLDTGTPVAESLSQLAADLRLERRAAADETARRVAVHSAGPLGLCFLPAFVLVGIVPTIVGAFHTLLG